MASRSKPKTRHQSGSDCLRDYVGRGKEFDKTELPTNRAVIQQGILLKEDMVMNKNIAKNKISVYEIAKKLAPLITGQWTKANALFCPPVIIAERSLITKVERLWNRAMEVALGRTKILDKMVMDEKLDQLLDLTTCQHPIMLCNATNSGCTATAEEECTIKAHIKCDCLRINKIPVIELQWLYMQRNKRGEQGVMKMGCADWKEHEIQVKAAKNKAAKEEAELKSALKKQKERADQREREKRAEKFMAKGDEAEEQEVEDPCWQVPITSLKNQEEEVNILVDKLLHVKLGKCAHMVVQYLNRSKLKRNTMPVPNTAKASIRWGLSPPATATIVSAFLKDLIEAGHLSSDMKYLACDPSKLVRARKDVMEDATEQAISTKVNYFLICRFILIKYSPHRKR